MGISDNPAVLTHMNISAARKDAIPRMIWVWDRADWPSLRQALHTIDWESLLRHTLRRLAGYGRDVLVVSQLPVNSDSQELDGILKESPNTLKL